ncbi:MAG: AbrB/MazE/SpoVT family DNA-binding domain-containing protein [Alphaproteobacteria bacterium]|nr:AbrB/MazE/SpoVT family DNA-binding domain-containing protein [Alphaproteobacteria bacterium]
MPKVQVRGDKLTVTIPARVREAVALYDGEEMEVSAEGGKIVLTPATEELLPGELEALDEAEAEFRKGKTHRLDDVLNGLGRKAQ